MKNLKQIGSFLLCLLINLFLNFEWIIPVIILLALHFWLGISYLWSILAIAIWIICTVLNMLFIGWAAKCGNITDKPKENKNPYSATNKKQSHMKGDNVHEKY